MLSSTRTIVRVHHGLNTARKRCQCAEKSAASKRWASNPTAYSGGKCRVRCRQDRLIPNRREQSPTRGSIDTQTGTKRTRNIRLVHGVHSSSFRTPKKRNRERYETAFDYCIGQSGTTTTTGTIPTVQFYLLVWPV